MPPFYSNHCLIALYSSHVKKAINARIRNAYAPNSSQNETKAKMKNTSNRAQNSTLNIGFAPFYVGPDQVFYVALFVGLGLDMVPDFFVCRIEVNGDSLDFLLVLLDGLKLGFAGFGHG